MTTTESRERYVHSNEAVPGDGNKTFFYDSDALDFVKNEVYSLEMPEEEREIFLDAVGRGMTSTIILQSPTMSMVRVRVPPFAKVAPHRHGTNQITYVLSGELHYGK